MTGRDDHQVLGYNYRMNEMAAAMGLVQLKKLDAFNKKRIENSLSIIETLRKNPRKWFQVPKLSDEIKHTFFWCPLKICAAQGYETRDVVNRLRENHIEVRHRYYQPLYKQKVIQDCSPYPNGCPFSCRKESFEQDYKNLYLPNVEEIAGNIIGLPNHPALQSEHLKYIIETVLNLY
jgi:dTDP-4-amino-4,6-dideoxygalactose transaminase